MSKVKWFAGNPGGVIVDDQPMNGGMSEESWDYYGGNVIAESIGSPQDMALMLAAPEMLAALKYATGQITIKHMYDQRLVDHLQKVIDQAETLNFEFEVVIQDKDYFQCMAIHSKTEYDANEWLTEVMKQVYPGKMYHIQKTSITNILPHKELKQL